MKITTIRIPDEDLALVAKLKIDLPELVRQALKQEISKRKQRCVTCGQAMPDKAK